MDRDIELRVDRETHAVRVDTRTTLLDLLRDRLGNMSPKKGCDHGQCGACTVLVDGRRTLSCLLLAAQASETEVVTAAGLAPGGEPHPVQQAFLDHDGYQCGYCTPGQICSGVGVLAEMARDEPSHVTEDLTAPVAPDREELKERMSGNLCRCGAHPGIIDALEEAARK
ncbi:2Fe-2S iron-sulfur cluster-binding protein [Streptomyces sp. XM4193]|uniref:(2Fe-2S)-binding protein n=1 Tax=Streptomyces sp. XM4193 TaxID=2929782 RepID=UPI001FFBEFEA|nr:2Fe-2S iron-sulfur cluster-binding protein [Streptomyces sp. XM4193]MCK1795928.1 2Fe-2S iron-sulfur cluster-binding protein [Streptomyces sp. XM4193]